MIWERPMSRHCLVFVCLTCLSSWLMSPHAWAQPENLGVTDRSATRVTLLWQSDSPTAETDWSVTIREAENANPISQFQVKTESAMTSGDTIFFRFASDHSSGIALKPETEYEFSVNAVTLSDSSRWFPFLTTPEGVKGRGGVGLVVPMDDPIARRLEGAGRLLEGRASLLEAQGVYLHLQAEARVRIAQAVDLELQNWRTYVYSYFARRETNEIGKMRLRDLADIRKDQTLHLKDTAARRRYEYVSRHAKSDGGNAENLEYLKGLFIGTPIGYGVPLQELFPQDQFSERWRLTPEMLHQLRVRSRSGAGVWLEFRLDEQKAIEMEWPTFFRQPAYTGTRGRIDDLNGKLAHETDPDAQWQLVQELADAFDNLSREFFRSFGPSPERAKLDRSAWRRLTQAEDFLHQKHREMTALQENPQAVTKLTNSFVPEVHGQDAGTLIAWMNSRGVKFAKPLTGEDASYQRLFMMMHELYALSDAPILDVALTEMPLASPGPLAPVDERPTQPREPAVPNQP